MCHRRQNRRAWPTINAMSGRQVEACGTQRRQRRGGRAGGFGELAGCVSSCWCRRRRDGYLRGLAPDERARAVNRVIHRGCSAFGALLRRLPNSIRFCFVGRFGRRPPHGRYDLPFSHVAGAPPTADQQGCPQQEAGHATSDVYHAFPEGRRFRGRWRWERGRQWRWWGDGWRQRRCRWDGW